MCDKNDRPSVILCIISTGDVSLRCRRLRHLFRLVQLDNVVLKPTACLDKPFEVKSMVSSDAMFEAG